MKLSVINSFRGLYRLCACGCGFLIPCINKRGEFARIVKSHNIKIYPDEKERMRQYRLKNKDRIKEKKREYQLKHKEEIRKWKIQYDLKNKERIKEWTKQYNEKNRERFNERKRQYIRKNKDRVREWKRNWNQKHQMRFLGKIIYVDNIERTFQCSCCRFQGPTDLHHLKYDLNDPLKYTVELCDRCHMLWHFEENYLRFGIKRLLPVKESMIEKSN